MLSVLRFAAPLLAVLAAAAGAPGSLRFSVHVAGMTEGRLTITGPEAELAEGPFRGTVSVNGSPAEFPISGTVVHADGKFRLPVTVRFKELPEAWTEGFNTQTFTYRVRGKSESGGAARDWTGTQAFQDVEV